MNYLSKRKSAFRYAFRGLADAAKRESHMRIHLTAALGVMVAGWLMDVAAWEWVALVTCSCLVLICELFNSAIEKICDLVSKENNPVIGYIKDISAGAVLLACFAALVTGMIIFLPRLVALSER